MANFYLDTNGTSELGQSSTPVRVNGTAGNQDRILLLGNAANVTVGPAVEIVDFAGSVADYQFVTTADGGIAVYRGATLVANVGLNPNTSELRFAEGGLTLAQDAETGAITVGGQEVSGERAEYTGDGMLTGQEHQTRVDGGDGPSGKGQDYTLPDDYEPGNIIHSDSLSNTYTTALNGLRPNAQIVDDSGTDRDVLNLHYDRLNLNGQIVNVETINAIWEGNTDGEFDADKVTSAAQGGTVIVASTTSDTSKNFVVENVKGNSVTGGDGVSQLTVKGIKGGGTMDVGKAGTLELQGTGATTVKADKTFILDIDDFTTSRSKVLTIENTGSEDILVSGLNVHDGAYVQAAGRGGIILSTGLDGDDAGSGGDISHLSGFKAIGVSAKSDDDATYTIADGQTIILRDGSKDAGKNTAFTTDGKAYGVELTVIAGERELGALSIADGDGNPKKNEIAKLTVDTGDSANLTIADLISDGAVSPTKGSTEPGNDTFAFTGKGNVTVTTITSGAAAAPSGGGIIDASKLGGRLTVGTKDAAVEVGESGHSVAISTGEGGSEIFIGDVASGLFFLQGGAGKDKLTLTGNLTGNNDINSIAATVSLGAGDDTVVLDKDVAFTVGADIDFGGGNDILQVKDTVDGGKVDFRGTLKNLNALEIGEDTTLTIKGASNGTFGGNGPAFELRSEGLILEMGKGSLDLSGITTSAAANTHAVKVKVQHGENAGTLTLNDALTEAVEVSGGWFGKYPEDIVTLKDFAAGTDKFKFDDSGKVGPRANIHKDAKGELDYGMFVDGELSGTSLKARLDEVGKLLAKAGEFAFYTDGADTYVLTRATDAANTPPNDADLAKVEIIRLEGTDYAPGALQASMGFVSDDDEQHTFTYGVDGATLVGTDDKDTFLIDKAPAEKVTVQGKAGEDELIVIKGVATGGSITADMGSSDDTVTLMSAPFSSNATLDLKGGDGDDILKSMGADLSTITTGTISIEGFKTLDVSEGTLTVGASFFGSDPTKPFNGGEVLEVSGDATEAGKGLTIELKNTDKLDISNALSGDDVNIDLTGITSITSLSITLSNDVAEHIAISKDATATKASVTSAGADGITVINGFDKASDKLDVTALGLTNAIAEATVLAWNTNFASTLSTSSISSTASGDGMVSILANGDAGTFVVFGVATNNGQSIDDATSIQVVYLAGVALADDAAVKDILEGVEFA